MSGAGNDPPPITAADLERLIGLLGMMGSAHDGEAENARRLANAWVAKHKVDWRTLLLLEVPAQTVSVGGNKLTWQQEAAMAGWTDPTESARLQSEVIAAHDKARAAEAEARAARLAASGGAAPTGVMASWRDAAQSVMDYYPHVLRGTRESDFLTSRLSNRRWATLTPAQEQWMRDICGRAGLSW